VVESRTKSSCEKHPMMLCPRYGDMSKMYMESKIWSFVQAEKYGVPRSSLHDNVKKVQDGDTAVFKPQLGRFKNTFSNELEEELKKHMVSSDLMPMPVT
jgi:predicted DNA-binding protein YlxM (UPF0122 family)